HERLQQAMSPPAIICGSLLRYGLRRGCLAQFFCDTPRFTAGQEKIEDSGSYFLSRVWGRGRKPFLVSRPSTRRLNSAGDERFPISSCYIASGFRKQGKSWADIM